MFFSLLKSKLQKKQGLLYDDLNNNIKEVIKTIPEDYYKRILNGTYNRQKNYIKKIRKLQRLKIGILNVQRCNINNKST